MELSYELSLELEILNSISSRADSKFGSFERREWPSYGSTAKEIPIPTCSVRYRGYVSQQIGYQGISIIFLPGTLHFI
jgi:hypothetical protein